ncbi:hypothetical protein FHS31_001779 [Sphingomonas vulcanisoli]|uniref:Uncharacterized protein n=1 Tax=Sphingomonas vulcanisoli TaxID=1658060 RepID=A0ABX0TRK9_9SPHN|nr:hypothetical protein [Sphingomonas vulcanisoli]
MAAVMILPKLAWGGGPPKAVEGRRAKHADFRRRPSTILRMGPLPPLRARRIL